MTDLQITPELESAIAESIMQNKPYLIKMEDVVQRVSFGTVNVTLYVRGGTVEKMGIHEEVTWLKDKSTKKEVDSTKKPDSI